MQRGLHLLRIGVVFALSCLIILPGPREIASHQLNQPRVETSVVRCSLSLMILGTFHWSGGIWEGVVGVGAHSALVCVCVCVCVCVGACV